MKRSKINAIIENAIEFLNEYKFLLPPFDYFTPEEWKEYYNANVDFFSDLGSPGGAAKMGVIEKDHPLVAALPVQEHDE